MAIKKKTYLISGGAGFVGSHLAEELVKNGNKVIIIDDFSNGSIKNLSGFKNKVKVIRGDISWNLNKLNNIFKPYKFDGIFHLACWPRSLSLEFPKRDLEVNALGTLNMLEVAKKHNCKLVFTSNSGIIGNPKYLPSDEKHPDQPSTPYDANKLVGEYYCKIYNDIHSVKVGVVRFAAVYGDRQRTKPGWKPLIAEFVDKISNNKSPIINWDGEQSRDFVYVKDAVQGVLKAFKGNTKGGEYYLISTNKETTVNLLFNTVNQLLGKDIKPIRRNKTPGDIRRMKLSYNKAKKTFDYQPKYSLKMGVQNYIDWYFSEYKK
ncbi:MAG: GDP-mannose 4,6-dehydratase [bacterium]|nr:GDP-mannose 4,6-dehydratase [bacterium]